MDWTFLKIPGPYKEMSCRDLVKQYQLTGEQMIIVYLIVKIDDKDKSLTRILFQLTKNISFVTTEDLFQEIFLFMQQKLQDIKPGSIPEVINKCGAWLKTIFRNFTINIYNREKKRPEVEGKKNARPKPESGNTREEDLLLSKIDAKKVLVEMKSSIEGIDKGWEIIYCNWSGKKHTECAEKLELTFNQYRGKLERARQILKDKFGVDYEKYLDLGLDEDS